MSRVPSFDTEDGIIARIRIVVVSVFSAAPERTGKIVYTTVQYRFGRFRERDTNAFTRMSGHGVYLLPERGRGNKKTRTKILWKKRILGFLNHLSPLNRTSVTALWDRRPEWSLYLNKLQSLPV